MGLWVSECHAVSVQGVTVHESVDICVDECVLSLCGCVCRCLSVYEWTCGCLCVCDGLCEWAWVCVLCGCVDPSRVHPHLGFAPPPFLVGHSTGRSYFSEVRWPPPSSIFLAWT